MSREQSLNSIEIFTIIKKHVGQEKADLIWREVKDRNNMECRKCHKIVKKNSFGFCGDCINFD